jgi:hypothetical protein
MSSTGPTQKALRARAWAILGAIFAVITVLGTLIGFYLDVNDLVGGGGSGGLTEEQIVGTISALQGDKDRAELQLTQIALADQAAANSSTQQAISALEGNVQATIAAIQAMQDAAIATRNAESAMTATQDAANAAATQLALDATATAQFLAEITPTPTDTPTITPTPEPVADYRQIVAAAVSASGSTLVFSAETAQPVPKEPGNNLAYIWALDTDRDSATGAGLQDIGVDVRVSVRFDGGAWIGRATPLQPDGTAGESYFFTDFKINGRQVEATLNAADLGLPFSFDWVIRAETEGENYSVFPASGHFSLGG